MSGTVNYEYSPIIGYHPTMKCSRMSRMGRKQFTQMQAIQKMNAHPNITYVSLSICLIPYTAPVQSLKKHTCNNLFGLKRNLFIRSCLKQIRARLKQIRTRLKQKPRTSQVAMLPKFLLQLQAKWQKSICYKSAYSVPVHKIHLIGIGGFCMLEQFAQ